MPQLKLKTWKDMVQGWNCVTIIQGQLLAQCLAHSECSIHCKPGYFITYDERQENTGQDGGLVWNPVLVPPIAHCNPGQVSLSVLQASHL